MQQNAGTSLVELLLGVGILALIGVGVGHFFRQSDQNLAALSSRQSSDDKAKQILKLIERDVRLQVKPTTLSANGLELEITRLQIANSANPQATYTVHVKSLCTQAKTLDMGKKRLLEKIYSAANLPTLLAQGDRCLQKLACGVGRYPRVEFTPSEVASANVPSYVPATFPDFEGPESQSLLKNVAGSAVCFDDLGNDRVRISLETVTLVSASIENPEIRVVRKEIYVTNKNIAGVQILP